MGDGNESSEFGSFALLRTSKHIVTKDKNLMHRQNMASFVSVAPGRLCVFGEHQDYLELPVIALALPLYCRIEVSVEPSNDNCTIELHIPQLNRTNRYDYGNLPDRNRGTIDESLHPGNSAPPVLLENDPDFALAALQEAYDSGWRLHGCIMCRSISELPIRAGCSSSSAFVTAWIQALAYLANIPLSPLELAQRAFHAEVTHFNAPGGTMDHITSAYGGILRIGPDPWHVQRLPITFSSITKNVNGGFSNSCCWILAFSGEEKDTMKHLHRCKTARLQLLEKIGGDWDNNADDLSSDEIRLLKATRTNRDTEHCAAQIWMNGIDDVRGLGTLMIEHHEALRDGLHLSTPRIERIRVAALEAGAWGFKIVGSGGGGCVVAWGDAVAEIEGAMKAAGATQTWIISNPSQGARIVSPK